MIRSPLKGEKRNLKVFISPSMFLEGCYWKWRYSIRLCRKRNKCRSNSGRKFKHNINPGIPPTFNTMGVNITTIAYLRALIIEIGSTIILMVVEAQGITLKNKTKPSRIRWRKFFKEFTAAMWRCRSCRPLPTKSSRFSSRFCTKPSWRNVISKLSHEMFCRVNNLKPPLLGFFVMCITLKLRISGETYDQKKTIEFQ